MSPLLKIQEIMANHQSEGTMDVERDGLKILYSDGAM